MEPTKAHESIYITNYVLKNYISFVISNLNDELKTMEHEFSTMQESSILDEATKRFLIETKKKSSKVLREYINYIESIKNEHNRIVESLGKISEMYTNLDFDEIRNKHSEFLNDIMLTIPNKML